MKAYEEGRLAFHNGLCPYDEGTPEWEMWCDGWDDASDEQLVKDQKSLDEAMSDGTLH